MYIYVGQCMHVCIYVYVYVCASVSGHVLCKLCIKYVCIMYVYWILKRYLHENLSNALRVKSDPQSSCL